MIATSQRGKRRPPWLRGRENAARLAWFLREQAFLDEVLAREGFNDIESGGDLNRLPATTVAPVERSVEGEAEFWRAVGREVADLPWTFPEREFLVSVAETGNLYGSARKHGITHAQGRWAFRKLLIRAGLEKSPMVNV